MNSKSLNWRMPLIAVVIAISLYYAVPPLDPDGSGPKQGKIKLGLDLQGGMHLALKVDTSKLPDNAKEDATARAVEVIRNRIDQFGVSEPSIQREGTERIIVQLPGVTDRERALALLGKTALLEFKLVSEDADKLKEAIEGKVPEGFRLYKSEEEDKQILVEQDALLTGKSITNAGVSFESQFNEPVVTLEFDSDGGKAFSDITGANVGRRLAIILDDKVQSAPVVNERIPSGSAQITGRFSMEAANDLSIALRAGALPAPIIVEEERSVGASLGKDSVRQGVRSSLFGFGAVVVFMLGYYLFGGLVANIALCVNILIILAALSYFQATLTLPGIAGAVLTIGMAVDTNVLIFERIREELQLKKPMAAALIAGYKKAFSTIFDANFTTLITAGILYYIGSGPIRGFALTLAVGIIASMFTGIFITRAIFDFCLLKGGLKNLPMMSILTKTPNINFLKVRRICYALSLIVLAVGVFAAVKRGPALFGVEFTGGTMQEYKFEKPVSIEDMRTALSEIGYGTATIQKFEDTHHYVIRAGQNSENDIQAKFKTTFSGNSFEALRIESIGPVIGQEMKTRALWALLFSLFAIWLYVVIRFDFRFAFGAILALFHDALIAVGAVALSGREFSVPVLAAVLTVLGFSINDTIVIFDRIRERKRLGIRESFDHTVNISVNQTLSRTILTTFTVFLVVSSIYLFGGEVINDFAFTMLVGIISGTYSTVYIAAPVLVDWPGSKKK